MDDKLMYIPNEDEQNYTFCRLKLLNAKVWKHTLFELTYQYLIEVPKVFMQRMRERTCKTLGTTIIHCTSTLT